MMLLLLVAGLFLRAAAADAPGSVVLGIVPQERENQLVVRHVAEDTPADHAGIRPGDVLLSVAGHGIATREDLQHALQQMRAGKPAELRVLRGGEEIAVTLTPALRASALAAAQPTGESAELAQRLRPLKDDARAALAAMGDKPDPAALKKSLRTMQHIVEESAPVCGTGVLRLDDAQGSLEVSEEYGRLMLNILDADGVFLDSCAIDTAEQCRALPPEVLARCRSMVNVEHYSRAERSGIQAADTVLSINGTIVTDDATLKELLETAPDGALVEVERIDHTEVLELAPLEYNAPVRELKVDWDELDAEDEELDDARNALLWELSREHPDNNAVMRAWKQLRPNGLIALADEHGSVYLYRDSGALTIKECGHLTPTKTYRSTLPLPEALRRRLLDFRN
ncbi:MAG: PDZ domain-containing protein [Akkermansia sp.]|nr:PDZ domain-containing protein [Akkermansia sp.]